MRIFLSAFVFFVFFSLQPFAQTIRHTSFDDRSSCEDSSGVWRQFGNGCVDQCRAKLDQFAMCAQAITFGCECGKTRCWNGEVCVLLSDYKEIFDKKLTEEQKVLDEAKEKRKAMAKGNEEKVLKKLSNVVVNDTAQQVKNGQSESQNQVADSQKAAQDKNSADGKKTIQEMAQDLKKKVEGKIPPLFLQQEEAKKQAQETVQETSDQAAKKAQQIQKETVKTNEDGKAVGIQIPGLPTISLPN